LKTLEWITRLKDKNSGLVGEGIDLTILFFQASVRPHTGMKSDILTVFEVVKNLKPNNIAFVFTMNEQLKMGKEKA
jgi:hypothetical protein